MNKFKPELIKIIRDRNTYFRLKYKLCFYQKVICSDKAEVRDGWSRYDSLDKVKLDYKELALFKRVEIIRDYFLST